MTDLARLSLEIDSRQVRTGVDELDKLTTAGARAEGAVDRLGDEAQSAGRQIKSASQAASEMARDAQVAAQRTTGMGGSARLASHHVQNLSFQLQDMVVGLQSGQRPMTVFLQQGSQIAGVMQQAQIGVGGLAKELARMAGRFAPAIAAMAAGALVFGSFKDDIEDGIDVTQIIADLGLTKDEIKELEDATVTFGDIAGGVFDMLSDKLSNQVNDALSRFGLTTDDVMSKAGEIAKRTANIMIGALTLAPRLAAAAFETLPGAIGDAFYSAVDIAVQAINSLLEKAVNGINAVIAAANKIPGVDIGSVSAPKIGGQGNPFSGGLAKAGGALGREFIGTFTKDFIGDFADEARPYIAARTRGRLQSQADELIEDRKNKSGARKKAVDEEAKALEKATKAAEDYLAALELETAQIGKSTIQIKQMEVAAKAAAADNAGLGELAQKIRDAGDAWEEAYRKQADSNFDKTVLQPLRDELALLGLVGPERELAALALQEEAFKASLLEQGVTDVNARWEEYLRLHTEIINRGSALDKEADAAARLADEINRLIGEISGLGGVGSAIGGLLGIATGQIGAVSGPLGALLNVTTAGTKIDEYGNEISRTIGDELRDIFGGENSPFVKSMQSALQGAGTGLIASNALGFTGTGSQIGSAIGGALGETLGKEFLSKGLESIASGLGGAAGPLGAIAGGLLGGALGSLLSSTPRGSATIGNVGGTLGVTGTRGTSQARIAASEKSAGAIIDSLDALAAELGATIDPTSGNVSIGIRKGNYRVDTTGSGITKTKNGAVDFGQDAEAAALYAMQDLIRDGVLVGLRKGTENLLKNASDLEVGVQKALAFEGVFTELKALQDPLGSALDTLDKEFTRLRDIFEEAGATAEEYAQLEELLTIKRQDAIDDSIQRQIDDLSQRNDLEVELLRLLGREEEALAQAREYELAAMEDTLRPLQSLIYQLQDANAIIAQFSPLSDDLKAFRNELLGGGNDAASVGFLATRFRSTASLASQGDADALGQLRGTASDFLEAARDNASSALEYQRAVGEVLGAVDSGIFAADAQIEYAQLTIDAIDANRDELLQVRRELATTQQQIVENTSALRRLWERYDGDGLTIKSDQDTPIFIKTAPGDTVTTA